MLRIKVSRFDFDMGQTSEVTSSHNQRIKLKLSAKQLLYLNEMRDRPSADSNASELRRTRESTVVPGNECLENIMKAKMKFCSKQEREDTVPTKPDEES